jgi:hypothetical protein
VQVLDERPLGSHHRWPGTVYDVLMQIATDGTPALLVEQDVTLARSRRPGISGPAGG